MSARLGRRLPPRARFAAVAELYALDDDERARTLLWVSGPGAPFAWVPIERLLRRSDYESSLAQVPSGCVLVVRTDPS